MANAIESGTFSRASWTIALATMVLLSCDDPPGGGDAAFDGPGLRLKYAGRIELTFEGAPARVEVSSVAFALPADPPVTAPDRQQVVLRLNTILLCSEVRRADYSIRGDDGTLVASLPDPACGGLGGTGELAFDLGREILDPNYQTYLRLEVSYPVPGRLGPPEILTYRFYVADFTGRAPPPQLRATPNRFAPGWGSQVTRFNEGRYTSSDPATLAPTVPLRAHEELRWAAYRSNPATGTEPAPLASVSIVAQPSDVGDGIRLEGGHDDGLGGLAFSPYGGQPEPILRSWSTRGLIPGELYDVRFVGRGETRDDDGFLVPPTQDERGAVLEAWSVEGSNAPSSAARDLGARYAFRVHALRIESPQHRLLTGLGHTEVVEGARYLVVRGIVPDDHPDVGMASRLTVTVAPSRGTTVVVDGDWPLAESDSPFVLLADETIGFEQADVRRVMRAFAVRVPVASDWQDGNASIVLALDSLTGNAVTDSIETQLDLQAPTIPPMCSSTSPNAAPCTYVIDGDQRDCRIDDLCIPDTDAVTAIITLCGETREVRLRRGTGTPSAPGNVWMCTGPIETDGASDGSGSIDIELVDAAGNRTLSDANPGTPAREPLRPTCFLPDRFLRVPYTSYSTPIHVRTAGGIPVVVHESADGLSVSRHDGLDWRTEPALVRRQYMVRGRIAGAPDDDGNTWFCATLRERETERGWNEPAFDNLSDGGLLALGRIDSAGAVTVDTLPFLPVTGAGCGIAYETSTRGLVVTANAARRPGTPGAPWVRRCDASVAPIRCSAPISIERVGATRLLGYEPDVSVIRGVAHVVGRGTLVTQGQTPRFGEFDVYEARVPLGNGEGATLRLVHREQRVEASGTIDVRQGMRPRTVVVGGRPVITFLRSRSGFPARAAHTLDLVADVYGTLTVIDVLGAAVLPFAPTFPGGPLELPFDEAGNPRVGEVAAGYDVRSELGVALEVAYQRRNSGLRTDVWSSIPDREGEDRSSLWYRRFRVRPSGEMPEIVEGRTRVDVETGHEPSSARHVSLYVDRSRAPLSAMPEPSVLYDSVRYAEAAVTAFLYSDQRVGQFVEHRDTTASQGRSPLAPAFRAAAPTGTCWADSAQLTDLSEPEANLTPQALVDEWASPRLDSTVTGFSSRATPREVTHREATGVAECLLRTLGEQSDGTQWDGDLEQAFANQVRERFAGNYLSLASSLSNPGPAVLQSRRFASETLVPAGSLTVDVDGRRFTGALAVASDFQSAASRLNRAMSRSGSGAPIVTFHEYAAGYRLAIHTQRPSTGSEVLQVLDTQLARALGFPIGQPSRSSWVDPRNGDYEDRLAACAEREPCVPNSAPGANDGTCGRPSECMAPGQALLNTVFQDVEFVLGSPPRRRGQVGVCVPTTASTPAGGDVCRAPHTSRPGTNQSYFSFESGTAPCGPFGLSVGVGRCLSCDDGQRDDALVPGDRIGPSGTPRLCSTDLDCNVLRDCSGPSACRLTSDDFLCTHLSVPFAGVPAGQGFCARPDRGLSTGGCVAGSIVRPVANWHPEPTCEEPGPPVIGVCRARYPLNPAVDFEPMRLECVASGCAACTGAYGPQSYCTVDRECPSAHRCVLDGSEGITSPACLLRPVLGDGRFHDSLLATSTDDRIRAVSRAAADELDVAPRTIDEGVRELTRELRAAIPVRYLATLSAPQCVGSRTMHRSMRALITGLRARTTGARITMVPDDTTFAGAGDILADIFLDGRIDVSGRFEGDVNLGAWHGFDTDLVAHVDAEGIRLRLRPYLTYSDAGPKLAFRVTANLMRRLSPTDPTIAQFAEGSNVHIDSSSQHGDLLDVIRFLEPLIIGHFGVVDLILTVGFENWQARLGDSIDEDTREVGDVVTGFLWTDALGPALFGEELVPLNQPTVLEGVTVQRSRDHSLSPRVDGPSLGIYGRRLPPSDAASATATERPGVLALLGGGPAGACTLLGQRNPDCLQRAADPSTCPPCGARDQECCGTCCGAGCPTSPNPTLTCTPDEGTGVSFCRGVTP